MAGERIGLTERDKAICAEVSRYGLITRDQLMRLGLFKSKTRANERLRKLTAGGYLGAKRQPLPAGGPRFLYLPGRFLDKSQEIRRRYAEASDLFVTHQVGLVDIRLAFDQHATITRWLSDRDLANQRLGFIPDGYCEYTQVGSTYCAFIEYDRGTETLGRIERKADAYTHLAFKGGFERLFHRQFFRVFVVADSERRLKNLSETIGRRTDRVFWFTTLAELRQQGPFASIWTRPRVSGTTTLTTT